MRGVGFPFKFRRSKLAELLAKKYPDIEWKVYILTGRYAQQRRLEKMVVALFSVSLRKPES